MQIQNVLIGSDPEVFVGNDSGILSAIGYVGGTKKEPKKVPFGALQEDNVLLEFNIDPAESLEDFQHNIRAVLGTAQKTISGSNLSIHPGVSSHVYYDGQLQGFGDAAFVFGCEPDFNCWTSEENIMPWDVDPNLRTAGGHLHIGFGHLATVDRWTSDRVGQMCDIMLGLPSLLMDKDDRRRSLYGKAGAIRYKSYGIEYRTLSNFWIFNDALMQWAYEGARAAYEELEDLDAYLEIVSGEDIQNIINTNDREAALKVLKALNLEDRIYA